MKKFFFLFFFSTFSYFYGMYNNQKPLSTSPKESWSPYGIWNSYNRKYDIEHTERKFWIIGIPINTNEDNAEFKKENKKTKEIIKQFEKMFHTEDCSYLNPESKEIIDMTGNRIKHITACIAWLCSPDTTFSNEDRLTHLQTIWKTYKDYIPPIFTKKLTSEVFNITEKLGKQIENVEDLFNLQDNNNNYEE